MTSPKYRRTAEEQLPLRAPTLHPHLALVDDECEIATPEETCAEMCRDLAREIEAAKRQNFENPWGIVSATPLPRDRYYHRYDIVVDRTLPPLKVEEVVLLRLPDRSQWPALVTSARRRRVSVSLSGDRSTPLPAGTELVIDKSWLLERKCSASAR